LDIGVAVDFGAYVCAMPGAAKLSPAVMKSAIISLDMFIP
jgi:hypothetical protein